MRRREGLSVYGDTPGLLIKLQPQHSPCARKGTIMVGWKGKACARCGGRKGPNQAGRKFCYRCGLIERREASDRRHEKRVIDTYGLAPGEYAKRYAAQGGRCALCRRATGRTKRLPVDHDHRTGLPRGLLCSTCNQILGHARDDPEYFGRCYWYLINKGFTG